MTPHNLSMLLKLFDKKRAWKGFFDHAAKMAVQYNLTTISTIRLFADNLFEMPFLIEFIKNSHQELGFENIRDCQMNLQEWFIERVCREMVKLSVRINSPTALNLLILLDKNPEEKNFFDKVVIAAVLAGFTTMEQINLSIDTVYKINPQWNRFVTNNFQALGFENVTDCQKGMQAWLVERVCWESNLLNMRCDTLSEVKATTPSSATPSWKTIAIGIANNQNAEGSYDEIESPFSYKSSN